MIIRLERNPIVVQTRAGNPIPNSPGLMLPEVSVRQARAWFSLEYGSNRNVKERKGPSGLYNCHGLTFLSRRSRLIDESAIQLVLKDDEYYEVDVQAVRPGDIILYYDDRGEIDHTGIVVEVPENERPIVPWILSQWNSVGEFIHRYNHCPYGKGGIRYMREGQHDEQPIPGN